ncbi:hypothetical protein K2173_026258 [Erythroxylum novogranatense]|uniref:Reverse transcriptase Ty1/copia-type domain-containing protein n=1 Tax=Erythroxylum novogranatense TaxID=1862640 RepID=A0AAV8SC40_9ROSI|nr:hypothetical protein K2173_026258 [Erythroxylum novogranatense]
MDKELLALEQNQTWDITKLPPGKKAIGSKWVYKVKFHPDGTVERVFLAIATKLNWFVHQLDINNAFLHGYLKEEVYLIPPEGYTKAGLGEVCKLKKSLYGLKQASRE